MTSAGMLRWKIETSLLSELVVLRGQFYFVKHTRSQIPTNKQNSLRLIVVNVSWLVL